jgi:hypothetical protein
MACSKLFSGDIPELINEVIQYFRNDYKTLQSCILVNRLWCRLAIPLLWEDPFSINFPKNHQFIEIYLDNLNEDDKTKLNEYIIKNDPLPSNTLFNYPGFIQHLDTSKISYSIDKWVETVGTLTTHSRYLIKDPNILTFEMSNFKKLIYKSLFQIFIENEVNLHSFEVSMFLHKEIEYFDEIFELMLQNSNFICNIKNFKIDFNKTSENMTKFSKFIHSNCNSVTSLYFQFRLYYDDDPMTEKYISLPEIIESQKNLKKILLGYSFPLHQSLLSLLKNPNCSNTLNTIIFYYVDFKNIMVLTEVFNQLNVLESIHIIYCHSLDSEFIQQINNIKKPFKLKSLFLNEILQTEELLIQKSRNYLENFGIINDEPQQLLQLVIKYCKKIKYLGRIRLGSQSIHLVFDLIQSVTQNLNYLTIDSFCFNHLEDDHRTVEYSSIILQNLGQILPFKLKYLHLILSTINVSDLELFLKNSQNTFIKKLLIRNKKEEESGDVFPYIEEYIMKEKRVKYFAFSESLRGIINDLSSLEDKVKEFGLYDIQVLYYRDSFINFYDFMREVD